MKRPGTRRDPGSFAAWAMMLFHSGKYVHAARQEQFERGIGARRPDQLGAARDTRQE
jgi:hypothetical protein